MDPDRHLPMPGRNPPRNPPPIVSSTTLDPQARPIPIPTTQYQHQQPSLPSIRQLHPYLPPSGATLSVQESPSYSYPPPGPYTAASGSTDNHPSQSIPSQTGMYSRSEALDSELDGEIEQPGPAKKKRRRQALSCNECKRRKIKCDRAQPCGPCTRRGEQSKCQWRSLEPVDKYVTRAEYDELKTRSRAEYDELKARLDHLETVVSRIFSAPPGAVNVPLYSISPDMSGATSSENISSYHASHSSTGQVLYPPTVSSSTSYQADHVPKASQYPSNSSHLMTQGTPQASSSSATQPLTGSGPSGHIRHPSDGKSPTAVRQSPHSLASITSPYNTDAQSKNCHAQTLNSLGGRLRPSPGGWKGPVVLCGTQQRWNTRRRLVRRIISWMAPWHSIYPALRLGGDMHNLL
ncbi:hypothetical protein BS17DRAFT_365375 [Gyrodon lividus]|nr:hypothetical protein BS17DRAFT_365375 [Gyrodon lividus]